jgi:hypothetical protein
VVPEDIGDVDALVVFDSKKEPTVTIVAVVASIAAVVVVSAIISTQRSLRRPCEDN